MVENQRELGSRAGNLTVLLVDRSGRGHAIADMFLRSCRPIDLHYVPGFGSGIDERLVAYPEVRLNDYQSIRGIAAEVQPDLIFVANTTALAGGLTDRLREDGFTCVGPGAEDCQLETSKIFGKAFCEQWGVPVSHNESFSSIEQARDYVRGKTESVVVKADGLCAGNGSLVCRSAGEAERALDSIMIGCRCGRADERVIIEDYLEGTELSLFGFVHANGIALTPLVLDYPWSANGNTGLICGGVGALAPHPGIGERQEGLLVEQVWTPIERGLRKAHPDYRGFIYIGCMMTKRGPYVLEINVRLGDPEAQALLPLISEDLFKLCIEGGEPGLSRMRTSSEHTCCVVGFQGRTQQFSRGKSKGWYKGWPYGRYGKGYKIEGLEGCNRRGGHVFAGEVAACDEGPPVTDGGRVVSAVGRGLTPEEARINAYDLLDGIRFNGMDFRTDIGIH